MIEYVIAISEEHSLSKAAERLFITQPALSQRLKKLEKELGAPLFLREPAGLSITDAGCVYINGGRSILQIKHDRAVLRYPEMRRPGIPGPRNAGCSGVPGRGITGKSFSDGGSPDLPADAPAPWFCGAGPRWSDASSLWFR